MELRRRVRLANQKRLSLRVKSTAATISHNFICWTQNWLQPVSCPRPVCGLVPPVACGNFFFFFVFSERLHHLTLHQMALQASNFAKSQLWL